MREQINRISLSLIHFTDENGVHFVYSPELELTGYGMDRQEAKESFEVVLQEFIEYATEHKTMEEELARLGWKIKHVGGRIVASKPTFKRLVEKREIMSTIFDSHRDANVSHREVELAMPV